MSLQYTWFSTIFGVYFWAGGIRGSLATVVLVVLALRSAGYLRNTITMEHLHDVAKLMFGFTVFWTYIAFAQYFLIWYGNMPEETQFYLLRRNGAWNTMSILLPILYFVVPFFMLLPRAHERSPVLAGDHQRVDPGDARVRPVLADHAGASPGHDPLPLAGCGRRRSCLFGVVLLSAVWGFQRLPLIPIRDAPAERDDRIRERDAVIPVSPPSFVLCQSGWKPRRIRG